MPDITDLGTVSTDQLTWTFKVRDGIRYDDGSAVAAADLAYAIKRSFARDVFSRGPADQLTYFAGGDRYKGPYRGGDDFDGVRTPDARTLVIRLAKPFPDLPYFMSSPLFTPVPRVKDTRLDYGRRPLATGPYAIHDYRPGASLTLMRNTHWDPATDAGRHQYPDRWIFRWGGIDLRSQQTVLNGGRDSDTTLSYAPLDATLIPQLTGAKAARVVTGSSPCTSTVPLDARKIPLEVRRAVALAYPYDQIWIAAGLNEYVAERATTFLPPEVPGHTTYPPLPGLTGTGKGDPAAARGLLDKAGRTGFELSWYYDSASPVSGQITEIRKQAFTAAGFSVKPIPVTGAELRARRDDFTAPVNLGQGVAGWCNARPINWFPKLFTSSGLTNRTSMGMLTDPTIDAEVAVAAALPADQATTRWGELDRKVMSQYVALPLWHDRMAVVVGAKVGGAVGDATLGLPFFPDMFLTSG